ncbi:hypothetical protein VTI74DRAFT_3853 [Chaetomium olivicolor]
MTSRCPLQSFFDPSQLITQSELILDSVPYCPSICVSQTSCLLTWQLQFLQRALPTILANNNPTLRTLAISFTLSRCRPNVIDRSEHYGIGTIRCRLFQPHGTESEVGWIDEEPKSTRAGIATPCADGKFLSSDFSPTPKFPATLLTNTICHRYRWPKGCSGDGE